MSRAVNDLVYAALRAAPGLATVVFPGGSVVGNPARYAVVWVDGGRNEADRLDGKQGNLHKTFTIHSVGSDETQAGWVQERVVAALKDRLLVIPGRNAQRLKHVQSRPKQIDRDVTPPLHYFVDQFYLFATPGRV